jgi:hypothetical protein
MHFSLADLFRLDGSSALQEEWTAQVRARWAAYRAFASETGSEDGAWLDEQDAEAIACDAAMAPVVTGDVNVGALEDLVRLCVELDRHRRQEPPAPDTTAASAAAISPRPHARCTIPGTRLTAARPAPKTASCCAGTTTRS